MSSMPELEPSSPSLKSGLTGGAAVGRGVDYQTLYAVHVALRLIVRLLRESPLQRPILVIEPRLLSDEQVTRWDLQFSPDAIAVEAKANVAKKDLIELLRRARKSVELNQGQRFELVYDECSVAFLRGLKDLVRLAEEGDGDEQKFVKLCRLESSSDIKEVLAILGDAAFQVGQRLTLRHLPTHLLHETIELHLRFVASPASTIRLKEGLYTRFVVAMQKRQTFFIPQLMDSLKSEGVDFNDSMTLVPKNIHPSLHISLHLLQQCNRAIPLVVLALVCSESESALRMILEESLAVTADNAGLWHCNPLPVLIDHPNSAELLGDCLRATLQFISQNKSNAVGFAQVENAISLTRKCEIVNPTAATMTFGTLDKLLKRRGRKRDVLDLSRITVESARRVSIPTEDVRKAEIKALVCGYTWVFQRIGEFADAELYAAQSQRLGADIGWQRNTAFCKKCIGRLRRVQAEQEQNLRRRTKLLSESKDLLLEAIDAFSIDTEHGPSHPEVGDCFSLLARTHLMTNRVQDADHCLARARELITADPGFQSSKDYMDLLILEGEIHSIRFQYQAADEKFAEAIRCHDPDDAEKSEIAARVHLARGKNLLSWKNDKNLALNEVQRAAEIWEDSNEHFFRGLAEWTMIEIKDEIPKRDRNKLKDLSPSVRVEVIRLRQRFVTPSSSRTLAQRAELGDDAWKRLIVDATKNVAIRNRRW